MEAATIRTCPACGAGEAAPADELNGWPLVRCRRCGLRFTVDVPSDEELQAIYNRLYSEDDVYQMHLDEIRELEQGGRTAGGGLYRWLTFLGRYKPRPGDRLLEVGCGVGTFLLHAKRRGWQVEGTDLSETAVAASRSVHGLPVRVGPFEDLDFEPGTYRAIVTWEVLEHLVEPRAFLEKSHRLLTDDGILACSVPNEGPRVPYPAKRGPASVPPVHLNFWDRDSLHRFFDLNGFAPDRIITQRTMLAFASPRTQTLEFARLQAGALVGRYESIHLFAAARKKRHYQSA